MTKEVETETTIPVRLVGLLYPFRLREIATARLPELRGQGWHLLEWTSTRLQSKFQ